MSKRVHSLEEKIDDMTSELVRELKLIFMEESAREVRRSQRLILEEYNRAVRLLRQDQRTK